MPEGTARSIAAIDLPVFRPRAPWFGGDLQTLRNTVMAAAGVGRVDLSADAPEHFQLAMSDGSGDALAATLSRPRRPSGKPLAVLIHGLTGCEDSAYMRATAAHLLAGGYPVLRLNLRGAGPSRPLCRLQYHAGRSDDLRDAIDRLDSGLTADGIVVAGFSLGANMMLKFLGEEGRAAPVLGAAAISAPIDLAAAQRRLMAPRNRFYHRYVLARMQQESTTPPAAVDEAERALVFATCTVYQFDDAFVAPRNGFGTADNYYRINSARRFLGAIRVPTLVIHAGDDPWIPVTAYRAIAWRDNAYLRPLLPAAGGHVGFHGRGGPPAWHDRCLRTFFDALGR